jgi:hypothetical protein
MSRSNSRQHKPKLPTSVAPASTVEAGSSPASSETLLFRKVTGLSVDALNIATHGIKGKNTQRILDDFTLPIFYEHQFGVALKESPLRGLPDAEEAKRKLGELPIRSLQKPKSADVVGFEPYHNSMVVLVDYPDLVEEQLLISQAVHRLLDLPADYNFRIGSAEPGIPIIIGQTPEDRTERIANALPAQVNLSPVIPNFPV